jgi:hypothetical protein
VGEGERAAKPPGVNFSGTQAALSLDLTLGARPACLGSP